MEKLTSLSLKQAVLGGLAVAALLNSWDAARAGTWPVRGSSKPTSVQASRPAPPATPTTLAADTHPQATPAAADPAPPSVTTNPSIAAKLRGAGLNDSYAALYQDAAQATGTPWQLLAAVHVAETRQSGNTAITSSAGAIGPMQFMPATFNRYALDGNNDGRRDATNVVDAVYSAGRYLAASGASRGQYQAALYAYNHSNSYTTSVLATARRLGL